MTKAQFVKRCQVGRKMTRTQTLADSEYLFTQDLRDLRTKYRDGLTPEGGGLDEKDRKASTRLALKSMAQGISKALR